MDLNQEGSSESGVVSITTSPASEVAAQRKVCADCQTTRTPLWRSGPAGPRSLCNACGIRHRKQRRALLSLGKGGSEKTKKKKQLVRSNSSNSSSSTVTSSDIEMGGSVNLEIVDVGREMLLQRSFGKKKKKKLREEEEAAMLLMALSCGSVFA